MFISSKENLIKVSITESLFHEWDWNIPMKSGYSAKGYELLSRQFVEAPFEANVAIRTLDLPTNPQYVAKVEGHELLLLSCIEKA